MERLVNKVMQTIVKSGLVEVEVSARHVHLKKEDLEVLFGKGAELHEKRPLSQKGQFLSEERVTLIGPKGRKEHVAVLGPERPETQVELSMTDCSALGIKAPVRESGDLNGAAPILIEGPAGTLTVEHGVIVAHNHVHVPPEVASELGLHDKERVRVKVLSDRLVVFDNVIIRVSDQARFRMHIDFDEANAALVSGFTLGKILPGD